MEKIQGSFEVAFPEAEKTTVNYSREELSIPGEYSGNFNLLDDKGNFASSVNFNIYDQSGELNVTANRIKSPADLAKVTDRLNSVYSAIAEEKVNIQSKIDSLTAYYATQNPS